MVNLKSYNFKLYSESELGHKDCKIIVAYDMDYLQRMGCKVQKLWVGSKREYLLLWEETELSMAKGIVNEYLNEE